MRGYKWHGQRRSGHTLRSGIVFIAFAFLQKFKLAEGGRNVKKSFSKMFIFHFADNEFGVETRFGFLQAQIKISRSRRRIKETIARLMPFASF